MTYNTSRFRTQTSSRVFGSLLSHGQNQVFCPSSSEICRRGRNRQIERGKRLTTMHHPLDGTVPYSACGCNMGSLYFMARPVVYGGTRKRQVDTSTCRWRIRVGDGVAWKPVA